MYKTLTFKITLVLGILMALSSWRDKVPKLYVIGDSISIQYGPYLEQYNRIADEVFQSRYISVIDLFRFTKNLGENTFVDHVHYNKETRALQAAFIAGFLLK